MTRRTHPCKCADWTRLRLVPLTEHHPQCPEYDLGGDALRIVRRLLRGMEAWARSQNTEIHPSALTAYRRGKVFIGEFDMLKTKGRVSHAR